MSRSAVFHWFLRFAPGPVAVNWRERLRSCFGALLGIAVTGASTHFLLGPDTRIPFLVAPIGASAVLLFAVPAGPLSQPWSIIGGNLVSATIGVACARWIGDPVQAAALAVAASTCAMFALRCVHPPSGAVALTAVLGGPAVHALGFRFVAEPIAIQSLALLASALVYHAATGHRYPHSSRGSARAGAATAAAQPLPGVTRADLEAVVKRHGELVDIASDDLESLLHEAQLLAYARSFSALTCEQIMSRDVIAVSRTTRAAAAWRLLERHQIKALPVIDEARRVIGIVTRTDFVGKGGSGLSSLRWPRRAPFFAFKRDALSSRTVGDLMSAKVSTIAAGTPIADLIPLFAHGGHHHIPVLDAQKRLAGIITQADLIAGLYRQTQARQQLAA